MSEAKEPKTETTPVGAMGGKRGRSGDPQIETQKLPAGTSKATPKLSPELSGWSSTASRYVPSKASQPRRQAFSAGHLIIGTSKARPARTNTTSSGAAKRGNFTNTSKLIGEPEDNLTAALWDFGHGGVIYKTDQSFVTSMVVHSERNSAEPFELQVCHCSQSSPTSEICS